jgi:hypothetical protein
VLASNTLDDGFDASPAIVGDEIYMRGYRYLYAIAEGSIEVSKQEMLETGSGERYNGDTSR